MIPIGSKLLFRLCKTVQIEVLMNLSPDACIYLEEWGISILFELVLDIPK
jgi:hypothetical protein